MYRLILAFVFISAFGVYGVALEKSSPQILEKTNEMGQTHEIMPRRGDLSEILVCAGSNEVLWTTKIKENPYSNEANEARRKAGWYAAVAMWIFESESEVVTTAIKTAKEDPDKVKIFKQAMQCRKAPANWRE